MYTQTDDTQPDCDLAAMPVPSGGKTEGAGDYACDGGDCHMIVYQGTRLYELYQADITAAQRPAATFPAPASRSGISPRDLLEPGQPRAGLQPRRRVRRRAPQRICRIAPMLITAEELNAAIAGDGILHHALRFTLKNNRSAPWATSTRRRTMRSAALPAARIRCRWARACGCAATTSSTPAQPPAAKVVARTLQRYGNVPHRRRQHLHLRDDRRGRRDGRLRPGAPSGPHDFEMVAGGQRIGRHDYDCNRTPVMN